MRFGRMFFLILMTSTLGGANVFSPVGAAENTAGDEYLLRPGDRVEIKIYPEDDFLKGGKSEISSEGNITLPIIGKISVAGRKVIEAERAIAEILAADYLVNPEVVIQVSEYKTRSLVVLGAVSKPGTYQFPEGATQLSLLQAISLAGGFNEVANVKKIKVMRKSSGKVIRANAESIIGGSTPDVLLEADDVIHVSESLF